MRPRALNSPQNELTANNGADEVRSSGFQSRTVQSANCGVITYESSGDFGSAVLISPLVT
jgi:hypothetical protein